MFFGGGFELPDLPTIGTWAVFATSTLDLEWIVDPTIFPWDEGVPQGLELQRIWLPYSGDQYAELDAYDPVRIHQELLTTSTKGSYTLTYAWSPRPGVLENKIDPDRLVDKVVFGKAWRDTDLQQLKD